jgi:transposase-like protein
MLQERLVRVFARLKIEPGLPDVLRVYYGLNTCGFSRMQANQVLRFQGVFPHDQTAMNVLYLAIESAAKKWSMAVRNWKLHRIVL